MLKHEKESIEIDINQFIQLNLTQNQIESIKNFKSKQDC